MADAVAESAPPRRFARGCKPSPRHALLAARPHRVLVAPPPQFVVVPKKLSYWDNERDGVCVSSEEAFAKAWWSTYCGLDEVFASEDEVRNFAARHGWLDGATLTEVMDVMQSEGMSIGGKVYKDGGYSGVDYSDETVLQSALTVGPVKIAIDADALPSSAGNGNGWWTTNSQRYVNTDHCVGLGGYGTAGFLFGALGLPVPAGLSPDARGYLLFTWSSLGFITHDWLMGTCTEAWVRNPTTVGQSPAPAPVPLPPSPPTPPVPPPVPVPVTLDVTLTGDVPFGIWGHTKSVTLTGTAVPCGTAKALFGLDWATILLLLGEKAAVVLPIVLADIAAGKSVRQILADVVAALAK